MSKKWKVGAVYELVDDQGFLDYTVDNKRILPYVSGRFKVLELDLQHNVTSVENIDLNIVSKRSDGVILASEEREFFKRIKEY